MLRHLWNHLTRRPGRGLGPEAAAADFLGQAALAFRAGDLGLAQAMAAQALEADPRSAQAVHMLGLVAQRQRDHEGALGLLRRSLSMAPGDAVMLNNYGDLLNQCGRAAEAAQAFRDALAIDPGLRIARANLLFTMIFLEEVDPAAIRQAHEEWARMHAEPLRERILPLGNVRDPGRPLNIGYISADLRQHAVSYFMEPVFRHHDRDHYPVTAYFNGDRGDATTERLRALVPRWRDVAGLDDEALAARIREDGIDILVDLSGHLKGNRLLALARHPAPLQLTYLGYPHTTGMSAMDNRISDATCDPVGEADAHYTETLLRMPGCMWCYQPQPGMPEVGPLPALREGHVTFASTNNPIKVTDAMLALWARILGQVPNARLLVTSVPGPGRGRIEKALAAGGVDPSCVSFEDRLSPAEFWALYDRIDISLDTLPCNGGTTTCEGLWLGVPMVTLAGKAFQSRAGLSILTTIGLPELVARSADEYVSIATGLARDTARLAALRAGLRARMRASPLADAPAFTRRLEALYRDAWRSFCARGTAHRGAG